MTTKHARNNLVDMNRLAHDIDLAQPGELPVPLDAPTVNQVIAELDEIVQAADEEIARLKGERDTVRTTFVSETKRILADTMRLREGVRMAITTMSTLKDACAKLNVEPR